MSTETSLGEWACLAIIAQAPAHGWAVARRLGKDGDIGRIWQQSRPLTYRSIDLLGGRGWLEQVGEEPSRRGPPRVVMGATRRGRAALTEWLRTPTDAVRDLRSELLLKLTFCRQLDVDDRPLLTAQQQVIDDHLAALTRELDNDPDDIVLRWRHAATTAASSFLQSASES